MIKRLFDFMLSLILAILFAPIFSIIWLAIRCSSPGGAIYWSRRIGRNNQIFLMPKFRSMQTDTPAVATHLLQTPELFITPIGRFLRKTSMDELPQLWSILIGDMSFVGPRPALYNQHDLIQLRTNFNIHLLTPGLTGLAQVSGRDEIPMDQKVQFDRLYLARKSLGFDLLILWRTFLKVLARENVSH